MARPFRLPSDRELEVATRAGSDDAWAELRSRHVGAVSAVADARGRARSDVGVDDALARLRQQIVDDSTEDASTDFAVRAVRPRALSCLTGGVYGPTPPDASIEPPVDAAGATDELANDAVAGPADLAVLAAAFGRLSETWQTVLWHRLVENEPSALLSVVLARSPAEVIGLQSAAERGLFEAFIAVELETEGAVPPGCRPIVALLPGFERGTLAAAQHRQVDAHVADGADGGCADCRRRLALAGGFDDVLPLAVVPGITGLSVDGYLRAVGVAVGVLGMSALAAERSRRANRWARVGAVAVVVIALLGAALLIRSPFEDLDGRIADLLEQSTTTTSPLGGDGSGTEEPDDTAGATATPGRIELVFPGAVQGISYVPGGPAVTLGLTLSAPAPFYRDGTGTVDAGITNRQDTEASISFVIRTSPGVSFDELAEGDATCATERVGGGATCALDLDAGATGVVSLRFALDVTVPERVVVVPSIRAAVLDLAVETVPGLLLGLVGRGELLVAGNDLGGCVGAADCPVGGERNASSAVLDLPQDAEIDEAMLVWQGDLVSSAWASEVGLIVPGRSAALSVPSDAPSSVDDGFRSVADVTALVRSAGAGTYTVVRPPSVTAAGDGWWTLLVVTRQPAPGRTLFVVVDPLRPVLPAAPLDLAVPVAPPAPARQPLAPVRNVVVSTQDVLGPAGDATVTLAGQSPPGEPVDSDARVTSYALTIDSNEADLSIEVSTSTTPLRVAAIAIAIAIVQ